MHRLFIFVGAVVACVWFGLHWGIGAAFATGVLGGIIGIALASGIDEPMSVRSALPRWILLIMGASASGAGLGWIVDIATHQTGAVTPAGIVAGIIGLLLCGGIPIG